MKKAVVIAAILGCVLTLQPVTWAVGPWPRRPTNAPVALCETVVSQADILALSCAEIEYRLDIPAGQLRGITLTALPDKSVGEVSLDGVEAPLYTRLGREEIDRLVYEPADAGITARIGFIPEYGAYKAAVLDIRAVEGDVRPPEIWGRAAFTLSGMPLSALIEAADQFGAYPVIKVVSSPKKGEVAVSANRYIYTPNTKAKGQDSFTIVAVDSRGVYSAPCTIEVDIADYKGIRFADLADSPYAAEATMAAHLGLIDAQQVGEIYEFAPHETMSGIEFLSAVAAAVNTQGETALPVAAGVWPRADGQTGYGDSVVAMAVQKGYIDRFSFDADSALTLSDAVGIVSRAGGVRVAPVSRVPAYVEALPVSALPGYIALEAAGLLPAEMTIAPGEPVTREYAAALVYRLYMWCHG